MAMLEQSQAMHPTLLPRGSLPGVPEPGREQWGCAWGWPPAPIVPIKPPGDVPPPPGLAGLPQVGPAAAQLGPELIAC